MTALALSALKVFGKLYQVKCRLEERENAGHVA